jgi:hypothetical protein
MAHDIKFRITEDDAEFKIGSGRSIIGTLKISKGALVWFPKWNELGGIKIGWKNFDVLMKKVVKNRKNL